jgi:hypothetical protein
MLTGIATAILSDTSSLYPKFENKLSLDLSVSIAALSVLVLVVLMAAAFVAGPESALKNPLTAVVEVAAGSCFSVGLAVANMSKCSATISFLDLRNWNPALVFVMGGAIGITLPSFYFIQKKRSTPLLDSVWYLPTKSEIDLRLLVGAGLFGVGWGLVGACPGPALFNLVDNKGAKYLYIASLLIGVWMEKLTVIESNKTLKVG